MTQNTTHRHLEKDLRTLARFIAVYCDGHHAELPRHPVDTKICDLQAIAKQDVVLCEDCRKLLLHALVKRSNCPMDPKPACKHCPNHCYHPHYREQIRTVMAYSGRKLVMSGRLDYLVRLLF